VMYAGRIVEHAPAGELLRHPLHPYTQGLLECMPSLSTASDRLKTIPGQVPPASRYPAGCRFHPRCSLSAERANNPGRDAIEADSEFGSRVLRPCVEGLEGTNSPPALRELTPRHFVACSEAGTSYSVTDKSSGLSRDMSDSSWCQGDSTPIEL
jgi:oligopeptide/dipeptide ABC transporter ATP-binding protein